MVRQGPVGLSRRVVRPWRRMGSAEAKSDHIAAEGGTPVAGGWADIRRNRRAASGFGPGRAAPGSRARRPRRGGRARIALEGCSSSPLRWSDRIPGRAGPLRVAGIA
ncbi:hypothetical protein GCM10027168_71830 [Streptomyces capparidis]